ncbi:hypothetical protein [Bradyrhizobium ottawaense]|uniref:Uncharacterized protein n=1 Tax=Bradyrhizobium ottawaense TaxID=931866 RepID=A0ABY0QHK5_9BRAD|nr:hypothetical protein [Bradyrhizobium ottawaense]SDK44984.1 hypothetical protein SAMN05444163_8138 [Bradyrhizobium ottawaense]
MTWNHTSLIEDEFDDVESVSEIIQTNRGERRAPSRYRGEYRRSDRHNEDGYGEMDFS